MTQIQDLFQRSDIMISILKRQKVLLRILKFHYDHEFYFSRMMQYHQHEIPKMKVFSYFPSLCFQELCCCKIGVHCLLKKLLNRFALSKKSVTSLLSTSSGGISGILLTFTNVFQMVQHVLRAVFR